MSKLKPLSHESRVLRDAAGVRFTPQECEQWIALSLRDAQPRREARDMWSVPVVLFVAAAGISLFALWAVLAAFPAEPTMYATRA